MSDPIQHEQRAMMNAIANHLDQLLNGEAPPPPQVWEKRIGFVLLTTYFGQIEDGRVNYISNGERADIVAMLREILARFEGQPITKGKA